MELELRIDMTPNERRRFLGHPDITPMVELVSELADDVMMVVVEARLDALQSTLGELQADDGELRGEADGGLQAGDARRASR